MRVLLLAWLWLLPLGLAVADSSVGGARRSDSPWARDDAARALLGPWRHCAGLRDVLRLDESADFGLKLSARLVPGGVEAIVSSEGSGRDAIGGYSRLQLSRGRCDARGFATDGPKEWVDARLSIESHGGAAPTTLAEVASWAGAVLATDVDAPSLASARIVTQLWSREDGDAVPWPLQPEHPGPPGPSPATVWSIDALRSAGIDPASLKSEEDDPADPPPVGLLIAPVRPPRLLAKIGVFEIWELRFRARNGGGLIAVYDRARDRHRWVWGTHGDWPDWDGKRELDAQPFRVVHLEGDLLVVWNTFDGVRKLISIDLRRGTAHEIEGERDVTYRRARGGVAVVDEKGSVRVLPAASLRR